MSTPGEGILCDGCQEREAAWLMGEKTSISLSWPFLCNVCKEKEESAIRNGTSEWPSDFHITFDFLGPKPTIYVEFNGDTVDWMSDGWGHDEGLMSTARAAIDAGDNPSEVKALLFQTFDVVERDMSEVREFINRMKEHGE